LVFYHDPELLDPTILPLYSILKPLYDLGYHAVDLFFCLSGFIFFWLYSEKIKSKHTPAKEFTIFRFSRLYPLHLVTLIAVALGQMMMWHTFGSWFVCGNNSIKHFISQLFFASAVFGPSFNAPTWSVSVEVILYGAFFLVCRLNWIRWWQLLIYACLGEFWVIHHGTNFLIARGVLSFFIGGLTFQFFLFLWKKALSKPACMILATVVMLLWLLIPWALENGFPYSNHQSVLDGNGMKIFVILRKAIFWFSQDSCELVLFPLTLLTLAIWESRRGTLGRRFALLGDISYSTYLLHFPLQILFVLLFFSLGWPLTFFSTPLSILVFFAILIPISMGSYQYFERPAQSILRTRWLGKQKQV
jgi:peptidoglycan/LPS O-acetylase OafA/YrhL